MVHVVGLDDAGERVLECPHDAGEHRRRDLQPGGVLMRRELAGLLDGELRAEPVGVAGMAVQQHAELVDAVDDLVLVEHVLVVGHVAAVAEHLVERQHGVVARVVGVVARRSVLDRSRRSLRTVKKSGIDTDSLCVTRKPYWAPCDGHHVRTRVLAPGCSR